MMARVCAWLRTHLSLAPNDLLRDAIYRRLWFSVLTSASGMQIMLLALPLTAAVLLHASPLQMGSLTAMEIVPFVLFSLPCGVWLDRVHKLRVYIAGELTLASAAASVPIAWWTGSLTMAWLFVVAFAIGLVNTTAGSAAQIVLTQVVGRDRLIEANAKNALANSATEVAGPGLAGLLIRFLGAPAALLLNALLLLASASILRGLRVEEILPGTHGDFLSQLAGGISFVRRNRLLMVLGGFVATWQLLSNAATVVNILFATRILGMSGQNIGLSYIGVGVGTVLASLLGGRIGRRIGPGSCLTLGFGSCACSWTLLAAAPKGPFGVALFALSLGLFGFGTLMIFINFIALRQAVTPVHMLGRMTSTMRWLILIPGVPGALIGGGLGQTLGLRWPLAVAGAGGVMLTIAAWQSTVVRSIRALPVPDQSDGEAAFARILP